MMTTPSCSLWALSLLFLSVCVEGFQPLISFQNARSPCSIGNVGASSCLWMAPPKKKKKAKALTPKAGGFGAAPATSSASSTSNNSPQVRSVSGHTGSGTKPLRQAANTFDELRKEFGVKCSNDVYVRAPLNDATTFWFVGKIARRLYEENDIPAGMCQPTPEMAIWSQKRLILEYAKHQLRPQNLGGKFSQGLEVWLAPGDSEMECVQNKLSIDKVAGSSSQLPPEFCVKDVGFNPEIYIGDEQQKGGLRIARDPDTGDPINPVFEVNESA